MSDRTTLLDETEDTESETEPVGGGSYYPTGTANRHINKTARWAMLIGFGGLLAIWIASSTLIQAGLGALGLVGLALWLGVRWL